MNTNKILRVSLLLVVLTVGVWLLGRPGRLQPEGPARLQALNSLSASGAAHSGAAQGHVPVGQSIVHDPVSPAVVDFADVVMDTDNADSMYDRWLRGELDLDEKDSIVSEAQMARMIAEALDQPPDEGVQMVPGGPQAAAPDPGASFEAIDFNQSGGAVPPDPELAVGPDHMIAVVNVALAIYDKSGTALLGPTAAENLYSQASCSSGLYDPNVLYDEESDRWFIAYDQGPVQTSGGYCVLASQSGDPTGTYNEYFFPFNDASAWLDFPHAGVGDNHIFMGGNMFDYAGPAFVEGRIFAFDKSDLYAGAAVSAVERGLGSGGSTPQPLNLHGQSTGTWPAYGDSHYILTDPYNGATYALQEWDPETDTLTLVGSPNLGSANQPISVPQDGTGLIQANDWRPLDFEYRNGYGWTTMTVSCNPGSGAVDCIRWAQIDLTDASIGPAGTGTYGSNDDYRFFPDLAVNHCDGMAVGYTKSSSATYPAIWVSGRQATDPNGVLQAEAQLKAGDTAYTAFDGSPFRWGDYTGMTIDPDGETFWYLGQYSKSTGNPNGRWGTYIGSFGYADCSTAAAPPQIGVNPADLQGTQAVGELVTHTLTISNSGDLDLTWSIDEAAPLAPAARQGGSPLRTIPETIPAPETLARDFSRAPLTDVISDGGFEQGTPNPAWDESSTNFGTPLCTVASCSDGGGSGPHSGSWWAWFGGIDDEETGYVRQDVIVPTGAAQLSFWLEIPSASGTGNDEMTVSLDGDELFSVTDADAAGYATYTQVTLDVSAYADDGAHTLSFDSTVLGGGVTNFFVDDVALESLTGCDAPTDIPWAAVSPSAGTTISNTTSTVDVVFNAAGLSTGTYTGTLCVNSNDPQTPRVEVPLQMTVEEAAAVPDWSVYLPYIAKP